MAFGNNPITGTQGALPTNQFPLSAVQEPGQTNLTALEGGPGSVDGNTNRTAPASMYVKDGSDLSGGATTDAAVIGDVAGSRSAKLRGLSKLWNDVWDSVNHRLHVNVDAGSLTANAGTNLNTSLLTLEGGHIATIDSHTPALGQALAGASVPVVLTAVQQTALTPPAAIAGFALEAGHLATIDTSTAASKTDLDSIVTNTNKIPASPAQEGGNLATMAGSIAAGKAQVNIAQVGGVATQMSNSDGVMPANIPGEATYIYSSGGPVDSTGKPQQASFDRLMSLQGKGVGGANANITATVAGDTNLVYGAAPKTIMPGQKIQLSVGAGNAVETVIVATSYTPSSTATSIPLQFPVVTAGSTTAKWDVYSPLGPASGVGMLPTNMLPIVLTGTDGNNYTVQYPLVSAVVDGSSVKNVLLISQGIHNGTTIDRQRGNLDNVTLINASGVTGTQTSADQTNFNGHGLKVYIQASVIGAGSLITTIQGKDPVTGQYFTLLASLAVTDTALHVYTVYPGITVAANVAVSDVLPRTWNVVVAGASGTTLKVAASIIV